MPEPCSIEFRLPKGAESSEELLQLLSLSPSARLAADELELAASDGALPTTRFHCHHQTMPSLIFGGTSIPEIRLHGEGLRAQHWLKARNLPIKQLHELLQGRVRWIDHTGLNCPSQCVPMEWDEFIECLGTCSALYAYPTGEPWFFILPASRKEVDSGIQFFPPGRLPRFEIVELDPGACVGMQLDVQTDLSRREIEEALPGTLSASLPGLENYFRSVFLDHPWPGLEIRIDLRFGPGQPEGDWETGKWLAQSGRQCHNRVQRIPRAIGPRSR